VQRKVGRRYIIDIKATKRIAFTILTDEPNELVEAYRDRMPLTLADGNVARSLARVAAR
jgi:putative SOS response-associated peptidase YedK